MLEVVDERRVLRLVDGLVVLAGHERPRRKTFRPDWTGLLAVEVDLHPKRVSKRLVAALFDETQTELPRRGQEHAHASVARGDLDRPPLHRVEQCLGDRLGPLAGRHTKVDREPFVLERVVGEICIAGDAAVGQFGDEHDEIGHVEPGLELAERHVVFAVQRERERVGRRRDPCSFLATRRSDFEAQAASSAALALSATALKPAGSLTAMSASTLRSSSISAFLHPATNWL